MRLLDALKQFRKAENHSLTILLKLSRWVPLLKVKWPILLVVYCNQLTQLFKAYK